MSVNSQTYSYLRRRFEEAGILPQSRHGQNFLIDLNIVRLIASSAKLDKQDVVLEVGTGTGSLTAMLAQQAAAVVTVEIDPQMFSMASEELQYLPNVLMLPQDALKGKNELSPTVLDAVQKALDHIPNARFKLVSNLPYNVATPILSNLLACRIPPVSMTATIQKEVADRIVAVPATKDYGSLALWMQAQCDTEIIRVLPPTVFWPRPKVFSAIVHIVRNEEKLGNIPDLPFYHRFIRTLFLHRRKFLRSELLAASKTLNPDKAFSKSDVDALLTELNLEPMLRAEQLELPTVLRLCDAMRSRLI